MSYFIHLNIIKLIMKLGETLNAMIPYINKKVYQHNN